MRPDILAFNGHIAGGLFRLGVRQGKWKIVNDDNERPTWPFIVIWIAAAERANSPNGYYFRFELENYPSQAPNICIWDKDKNQPLAKEDRPKGVNDAAILFRMDWEQGLHLYAPYERHSLNTHRDWDTKYPNLSWKRTDSILKAVENIFFTLNSSDYYGK